MVWVAPIWRANSSFAALVSTATTWLAPQTAQPCMADSPTPPAPNTTVRVPASTRAVLAAAPKPVITPQPISAALSSGTSGSILTRLSWCSVWNCDIEPQPEKMFSGRPAESWVRSAPPGSVTSVLAPWSHSWGRPLWQKRQRPHMLTKEVSTWSPGARPVTPSPTSATMPAPSWPRIRGRGKAIVPLVAERSLWHTPQAFISTSTSPAWGFCTVIVSTTTGALSSRQTTALDWMLMGMRLRFGIRWLFGIGGDEPQGEPVVAEAQAGRRGAVVEDMPLVAAAAPAMVLGAGHCQLVVDTGVDRAFDRGVEA